MQRITQLEALFRRRGCSKLPSFIHTAQTEQKKVIVPGSHWQTMPDKDNRTKKNAQFKISRYVSWDDSGMIIQQHELKIKI